MMEMVDNEARAHASPGTKHGPGLVTSSVLGHATLRSLTDSVAGDFPCFDHGSMVGLMSSCKEEHISTS